MKTVILIPKTVTRIPIFKDKPYLYEKESFPVYV